jgi:hypothetical protein
MNEGLSVVRSTLRAGEKEKSAKRPSLSVS